LLEGQLLVLHYRNMETREKIIYRPKKQKKTLGPVIICLDTSGSMSGWPESVAKALCLALVHICRRMRRGLYLILFSTEVREMDLRNMEESIGEFSQFFRMEFRGGTDLRPALRASLRIMRERDFVDSDLLIISDFRVPKIMLGDDIVFSGIREHNRIHALTIGKQPMEDIFNIFDCCWHYLVSAQGQAIGMGGV
ncbi:MAG: VWA domain-containing protein, partial [Salinispira sp.]